MPTSTNVTNLKINELTEAQYDAAVQGGVIGENELSVITDMDIDAIQVSTMPTAAVGELDKIYQFIGTTDANYTNGYFYKCVSDGQDPATYSWTQTDVQPQAGGLPSQTGQSGKFLTTDGTDASWSDKPLVNTATGNFTHNLTILGTSNNASYAVNIGDSSQASKNDTTAVGSFSKATGNGATSYGRYATASGNYSIAVGNYATASGANAIAIGVESVASGANAIQIGTKGYTNSDANTFKVGNDNGNFEIMSADGTVPADRLVHAINKYSAMPTAASTNEGWIVQFTGTTDSTYTHGYIYECKAQGTTPETYAWEAVTVQAGGGGGGLPSQTGNSGKFLTTDGTDASWATVPSGQIIQYSTVPAASSANLGQIIQYVGATDANYTNGLFYFCYESPVNPGTYGWAQKIVDVSTPNANQKGFYLEVKNPGVIGWSTKKPLVNNTTATSALAIGDTITTTGQKCTALNAAQASGTAGIALGFGARTTGNWCCQIGPWTNSDNDTFKFGNGNGNFELMSADGTIPAARHATLPAADGTYTLQLVITNGVPTLSWVAA